VDAERFAPGILLHLEQQLGLAEQSPADLHEAEAVVQSLVDRRELVDRKLLV
jgi:hypothetical protein